MTFFEKLGRVFMKNIAWTVILIVAFIFFLYFAKGDLIGGILTAVSALVVYVAIVILYQEYKKMFPAKKPVAKKSSEKKINNRKQIKKIPNRGFFFTNFFHYFLY